VHLRNFASPGSAQVINPSPRTVTPRPAACPWQQRSRSLGGRRAPSTPSSACPPGLPIEAPGQPTAIDHFQCHHPALTAARCRPPAITSPNQSPARTSPSFYRRLPGGPKSACGARGFAALKLTHCRVGAANVAGVLFVLPPSRVTPARWSRGGCARRLPFSRSPCHKLDSAQRYHHNLPFSPPPHLPLFSPSYPFAYAPYFSSLNTFSSALAVELESGGGPILGNFTEPRAEPTVPSEALLALRPPWVWQVSALRASSRFIGVGGQCEALTT